jgi:hypothetical protein
MGYWDGRSIGFDARRTRPCRLTFPASGQFEVYCDGVGIFLAKLDGAPAPGKLVLFSRIGFPPGTMGGRYFGQGQWSDIYVFRHGCVPNGKCDSIADGKVWIDLPDRRHAATTHLRQVRNRPERQTPRRRLRRKTARQQTSATVVHGTTPA